MQISFSDLQELARDHKVGPNDRPVFSWEFDAEENEWVTECQHFVAEEREDGWEVNGFDVNIHQIPDDGSAMYALELFQSLLMLGHVN